MFKGREFDRFIGQEVTDKLTGIEDTFIRWYNDLQQLYSSVFKFEGMPLIVDMAQVEQWLMYRGSVAFFIDEEVGPLILPYTTQGSLNAYGNPTTIRAYGLNGYQIYLNPDQYVIIYDNCMKIPNIRALRQYAVRLARTDNTIDVNIEAQKTPTLLTAENEAQLNSLKLAYRKMKTGQPVIAEIGNSVNNGVNSLTTGAPMVFNELQNYKLNLLAEVLTFCGIPNRGDPKRERLITTEVSAINGHVVHERTNRLQTRQKAVDEINMKFGTYGIALSVDFANVDYNIGLNDSAVATPEKEGE